MRFSQRIGKKSIRTILQVESIDEDLMNGLWNVFLQSFFFKIKYSAWEANIYIDLWTEFYKQPIDEMPRYVNSQGNFEAVNQKDFIRYVRNWFYDVDWFEVYDFIEYVSLIDEKVNLEFAAACNLVLERELSGYRIISSKIIQITSEQELQAIEEAVSDTSIWKSVNEHLNTALTILADRKTSEYRICIKESISAVEALCKIITKDDSATLGKALAEIEKKHSLHEALKGAFTKIYGYTSDAGGIRHALLESSSLVGFEDAKFMLVSCSAFINYLKAKIQI
ncbi:MAG: hypothetical protein WKF97_11845 [Chitinophagaceae bacterium]